MDKSKEQIQEIFNVFDKDGNGTIEKEEIRDLAANVGLNWNEQKLNKILTALDTNGDGKISFDEFYEYFLYGEQKQLDKLIQKKFKHVKNVKNLQKKLSKDYGHIFGKNNEEGKNKGLISINVGEKQEVKSSIEFAIRVGQENKNFSQSLLKNFPYVGDEVVSIVFGFKCQNSDAVQEKFQAFFEGIIDLVLNMVPDDIAQKVGVFKDDLKIEFKALPEELLIRLYIHNEFTENILVAYRLISGMFLQENTSLALNFTLNFFAGLQDIGANPNENVFNWLGKGFQALFQAEASSDLAEYARQGHYAAIGQYFETNKGRALELLTPLALLQNVRLAVNFNSYQKFIEEMEIPELEIANLQAGLDQAKSANIGEMIGGIPFVGELLDILRTEGNGQIQIAAISQEASVSLTAKGEGAALIWEKLL